MRIEIKRLHQRLGTTVVYVTHDQVEAMTMADRIVVMRDGRILQVGTPTELYEHPVDICRRARDPREAKSSWGCGRTIWS
jgi:multiple sugar transport system ATP-binding protein